MDPRVLAIVSNILELFGKNTIRNVQKVVDGIPLNAILSRRQPNDSSYNKSIAEEILWGVTGDPYAPYYYGLLASAGNAPLIPQIQWIIDDYKQYQFIETPNDKIKIVNKNFQQIHRSGWQFAVDNMVKELNNSNVVSTHYILDTYVDKTFNWNCDFYQRKGVIPYTTKWVGFIHHTYSDYNNSYNCEQLFLNDIFLTSLDTCECLIVMSKYLRDQLITSLAKVGKSVRVEVVYHPSETPSLVFQWDLFQKNKNKQVIQVGNWLRNVFAIYELILPTSTCVNSKAVLKNKNSDSYFLPPGFFDNLFDKLMNGYQSQDPNATIVDICKISFTNMHLKGLYQHIIDLEQSVTTLEHLDNDSYDQLLSQNVVFINLVDASAVNTVIECILRNTPILVNPLPAVVECLGDHYPLYYNNMYDASKLLEDSSKLQATVAYLKSLDKSKFDVNTFVTQVKNILVNIK